MNGWDISCNFAKFSIFEEAISGVTSAITNNLKQLQVEQAETKFQLTQKRQSQSEYHQEMVDGMPLVERFKNGTHHF